MSTEIGVPSRLTLYVSYINSVFLNFSLNHIRLQYVGRRPHSFSHIECFSNTCAPWCHSDVSMWTSLPQETLSGPFVHASVRKGHSLRSSGRATLFSQPKASLPPQVSATEYKGMWKAARQTGTRVKRFRTPQQFVSCRDSHRKPYLIWRTTMGSSWVFQCRYRFPPFQLTRSWSPRTSGLPWRDLSRCGQKGYASLALFN